jgi:uncharacterized membrane protein
MKVPLHRWYLVAGMVPFATAAIYVCAVNLAFKALPQEVPIHFDFHGVANGWMQKSLWRILSPILLGAIAAMVFATRPGPFEVTAITYWSACGMITGAFFQINRAARAQRPFRIWPVLAWFLLVPFCQIILSTALTPWWKSLK